VARCNCVAIAGSALGAVSTLLPWLTLRANRLAAGEGIGLSDTAGLPAALLVAALWIACIRASLGETTERRSLFLGVCGAVLLPLTLGIAGTGATRLLAPLETTARASLGAGVWLSLLSAYVLVHTSYTGLKSRPRVRRAVSWAGPAAIVLLGLLGVYSNLSLMREFAGNEQRFAQETARHLVLCFGSVGIGTLIAVPLGIAAARSRRAERPVFLIASTIETVPSLALFGLIIAPLSALSFAYPVLRDIGIRGVGAAPALIALVLYSLLPIVHNTYVGLKQVSPAALDAGRGMGMSRRQLARKVEFPLAAPLVAEGVRTASVQGVGNTAVAALIGAGGLGHFIFQGLGQAAPDLILLGALPVIALALLTDTVMRAIVRALTPRGLRVEGH
jgi:osmoprotectant transport system permease protein